MRLQTLLLVGVMIWQANVVVSSDGLPGEPPKPDTSQFPNELRSHLGEMRGFFCPYCIKYCLDKRKPELDPESTSAKRKPPLLYFDAPDLFFPEKLDASRCPAVCTTYSRTYLLQENYRWYVANFKRAPAAHNLRRLPSSYTLYGEQVIDWILNQAGCDDDKGDDEPGRNPIPAGGREMDWDTMWQKLLQDIKQQDQQSTTRDERTKIPVPVGRGGPGPQDELLYNDREDISHSNCQRLSNQATWIPWLAQTCEKFNRRLPSMFNNPHGPTSLGRSSLPVPPVGRGPDMFYLPRIRRVP